MAEMIKLYKFKTNFAECLTSKKLFGNNVIEYNKHFHAWLEWSVDYCGNANIKTDGMNRTITFKYGGKRYKAEWIEY